MIAPPKFSTVAARYGLTVNNCDYELGRFRHTDRVLVLDTNPSPWKEFFVRAEVLTTNSDWQLFALDYTAAINVIILGNNRIPNWCIYHLLKNTGLYVDVAKDCCYYKEQLK